MKLSTIGSLLEAALLYKIGSLCFQNLAYVWCIPEDRLFWFAFSGLCSVHCLCIVEIKSTHAFSLWKSYCESNQVRFYQGEHLWKFFSCIDSDSIKFVVLETKMPTNFQNILFNPHNFTY